MSENQENDDLNSGGPTKSTETLQLNSKLVENTSAEGMSLHSFRQFSFSLLRVLFFAIVSTIFIASIFVNILYVLDVDGFSLTLATSQNLIIFGLMVLTAISLFLVFWNYHIRSIYLRDGPGLVPEMWGFLISNSMEKNEKIHNKTFEALRNVVASSEVQAKYSQDLMESFLTLQVALSSRDEEIARLRKGYDSKVFARFLSRFIRVGQALEELQSEFIDIGGQKYHVYLSRLMENALEECGVEKFVPGIGGDYREAGPEIADEPAWILTDRPDLDYKISDVKRPGYHIVGQGEVQVLVPARVSIFKFTERQEGV